ncbi:MAG: cation:proton antiporter [Chloroflexi bacterium]|nr:cation:proton antiporter [Chloroflexota bacterium]
MFADFAIIMGLALVGGLIAYRLGLPAILGYLTAGAVIGPHALGLVANVNLVETVASVGVVLLLFTLGMEFSIGDLKRAGKIGIVGGAIQIQATALVAFLVAVRLFGWTYTEAIFFGFLVALSSTMVVVKILVEKGETNTPHGKILIAILLVQDIAVLPLMIILPVLGQPVSGLISTLGLTLLIVAAVLGVMTVIGTWVLPAVLGEVAGTRSRELFLITILAIGMGAAFGTSYFGVSAAFGAFAGGMLISRSHFAHQALADIIPLRNSFAALFFVSLGMLAEPLFILNNLGMVLLVSVVILAIKFVIAAAVVRGFGYGLRTVLLVGAGLSQVGEFSFVIGQAGLQAKVISEATYSIILSSAILTILFAPLAYKLGAVAYARLSAPEWLNRFFPAGRDLSLVNLKPGLKDHVVVCGHGRTGRNLTHILDHYQIPYVVIEVNSRIIGDLRRQKVPCVYGDAGNPQILAMAHVDQARVLALTCPDPMAEVTATTYAREVNKDIDIIARHTETPVVEKLRQLGVSEVVDPSFEASLEFVRHTLGYYKVQSLEIESRACPFVRRQDQGLEREEPEGTMAA